MLWVTHDLAQLRRIADHVLVLLDGALAYSGPVGGLAHVTALDEFLGHER
jgi:ABC-type transporter Mla maintaining outer membrane lipid asymmetry ATPase subunit MlaF